MKLRPHPLSPTISQPHLQLLASSTRDNRSNSLGAKGSDLVWKRGNSKGTFRSGVDGTTKVNIVNNSEARLLGVSEKDGPLNRICESGALNKNLGAHTGVDPRKQNSVPVVVHEVHGSEPDQWLTAVDIPPVVVGVSDVKLALVL